MEQNFSIGGLNLNTSPFLKGGLLRAVNVDTDYIGAKVKRGGYITYLGTPDNSQVKSLFNWTLDNGTQFWNYRYSGSLLYYSTQGTGDWTVCGNGTFSGGNFVGHTVLNNQMLVGDGVNLSKYSTDGTSFSDIAAAPRSEQFANYQQRAWAIGTASNLFYSTVGTLSDWTSDSTSIFIQGAGKNNSIFKAGDRLYVGKNSGEQFRWDGYSMVDMATDNSYTSPYSIAQIEGYNIGLTRMGFYGNGGGNPDALSNAVKRQIYNSTGVGIAGTSFDKAPAVAVNYDYFCAVGTLSDDILGGTVNDCVMKYNIQTNEWLNWQFNNYPTAFLKYRDASGVNQFVWGDSGGQCYQFAGTATTDNGAAIASEMIGFTWGGNTDLKEWKWLEMMFSPGSRAKVQYCITDTFRTEGFKWIDAGEPADGVLHVNLSGQRGHFLFWKIYESSKEGRYHFYGYQIEATTLKH